MRTKIFLLFFLTSFAKTIKSQTIFWYETFGSGCSQGQVAIGAVPTATNGFWSVINTGVNGPSSNEWFISGTEAGMPIGTCGNGCINTPSLTNRTLHIGANVPGPNFDNGAFY